jgi:hypothetical protein
VGESFLALSGEGEGEGDMGVMHVCKGDAMSGLQFLERFSETESWQKSWEGRGRWTCIPGGGLKDASGSGSESELLGVRL